MSGDRTSARRLVTIKDVARAAGVSAATVSRVVNGKGQVDVAMRAAVEREVKRLGYTPNSAARGLVTGHSGSVAIVIPEPQATIFHDPFFARLLAGMSRILAANHTPLMLLILQTEEEERWAVQYLAGAQAEGALLTPLHGDDPLPRELAALGVPFVMTGRAPAGLAISCVDIDNYAAARAVADHLTGTGRRRLATITGPLNMTSGRERLEGFREGVRDAGLEFDPARVEAADWSGEAAERAMRILLERDPAIDAVFAASDAMAMAALGVLQASGRRVPEDVALVGFDDQPVAAATRPRLTTVSQPIEDLGAEAARLLLETLREPPAVPRQVILPTRLVVREST